MARSSECTERHAQKVIDSAGIVRDAIYYRGQRVGFREGKASIALGERRGAAPSPAPPSPNRHRPAPPTHPWKQGWQNMRIPIYSLAWQ